MSARVIAALLLALCGVGIAACGGDGSAGREPLGVAAVEARIAGVPQGGEWLGERTAPVTITEYVDLQCPACAAFSRTQLERVIRKAVRPGRAAIRRRVVAATLPVEPAAQAALIAQATGERFWRFTEIWLENLPVTYGQSPERVAPDLLVAAGVARDRFERALAQRRRQADALARARRDLERTDARRLPVIVVAGPAGRQVLAAPSAEQVLQAVRKVER